ncbi:MAG: FUSC family protein [Micavibrio aeruginosavorus]|uniref:FUSC family protein n=1 Tax=Micavibrio aeruginosavorus TaxID=349221 RepID=A0A2W5HI69_9BACT|nr:MAG: FUSC family protein [Micavibrio aeruginosavorus]
MYKDRLKLAISHKSFVYSSKVFIASLICWYSLTLMGIANPIWAVITVFVVSDPDLNTTFGLAKVRGLNTIVGCTIGLASIFYFGYSPLVMIMAAAFTVLFVMRVPRYPVNWRLAPVTVVILMDAGRLASTHEEELHYVMLRVLEIGVGSFVSLGLAGLYTRLAKPHAVKTEPPTPPANSE